MIKITGTLKSGLGRGKFFMQNPGYLSQIKSLFSISPYHGTLNIKSTSTDISNLLKEKEKIILEKFYENDRLYGRVDCYKIKIAKDGKDNFIDGIIVIPEKTIHPENIIEIISEQDLREALDITDDDQVNII